MNMYICIYIEPLLPLTRWSLCILQIYLASRLINYYCFHSYIIHYNIPSTSHFFLIFWICQVQSQTYFFLQSEKIMKLFFILCATTILQINHIWGMFYLKWIKIRCKSNKLRQIYGWKEKCFPHSRHSKVI